jgi:hypothetical protein
MGSGLYHKIYTAGEMYGAERSESIAKSANFVIPRGDWLIAADAASDYSIQFKKPGTTDWITIYPAGTGGIVISDGESFRALNNDGSNATTLLYYAIE